ncbi:MAG: two-component system OmpR family response regulator [Verrucomicrobiales bacterium]|jgi:two-component system OmpR family response regulator
MTSLIAVTVGSPSTPRESSATLEAVKVLVVEDEKQIASFVENGLKEQGFSVDVCRDGVEGMEMASSKAYDAIVLDIMLPGRDGLSILRKLREDQNTVPVILVTARDGRDERVDGLDLGADDYITKPFYMDELIARLRSVWRRSAGQGLSILSVADLRANLMTHEVHRGDERIELAHKEFALLVYLMRSAGRVLTRTQILEQVWEYQFDPGSNIVDSYIARLRRKIDHDFDTALIETLRGVGYRMKDPSES